MDWIEQVFHVSPDGGSGATEAAIVAAVLVPLAVACWRRCRRNVRRQRR